MSAETQTIVEVEESRRGHYVQTARTSRHELTVDEPVALGGRDAGPSPYEYLLIGLGACTSITLRMYAQMKDLPLACVRVKLWHGKIHATDCADCETKEGKVDVIHREITLEGDLTENQRNRLLDLADRCPVHRTLTSEIKVRSRLTPR